MAPPNLARRWSSGNGIRHMVHALHRNAGLSPARARRLRLANCYVFARSRDRCLGPCPAHRESKGDGPSSSRPRQSHDGLRNCVHALHRHGGDAFAAECRYDVRLVALSILIAVLASFAALWLAFYFRGDTAGTDWRKLAGSVALGVAIPAMHYTGMAAANFSLSTAQPDLSHAVNISTLGIAGIAAVTFVVLGLALLTSWVDRRFAAHALELLASNERYRLLFERNVAGIYRGTLEARILDCNDAFSRILGNASRKHLSQSACNILLDSADRETFLAALRNHKVLSSFEHCLRREDDAPIWVLKTRPSSRAVTRRRR